MDSLDLLAREDEFKKLNKQLEKKTESLMKEIEHAMQKQDFFSEFSHNLTLSPTHTFPKKHSCNTPKIPTPEKTPTKTRNSKNSARNTPKQPTVSKSLNEQGNLRTEHELHDIMTKSCTTSDKNDTDCAKVCTNRSRIVCDCCTMSRKERIDGDLEFLYAFVSVNVQEKILPPSFLKDRATVESVCKFLSSKIKLMQEHIDKLQASINKKASQCEAHLTQHAELESERLGLLNKANSLRAKSADLGAKCNSLQGKLNEKERIYKEQRSECDKLASEVKRLRSKNANVEARCASQEETIGNLKHQIDIAKKSEKEFRDSTRNLSASHESAISRLESRIKCLTTCIDRQNALIDNLRKQNALLSTEGALKALEKEYCNYLTQD